MAKPSSPTVHDRAGPGPTVAIGVIVLVALASAAVVGAARLSSGTAGISTAWQDVPDAQVVAARAGGPSGGGLLVPGSTRLVALGSTALVDNRAAALLAPGADVALPLPEQPPGTTAVLLEVSLLDATGPGAVTIESAAGPLTVLRVPAAKAMTSATVVVRLGPDGELRARTEGGGHLLISQVGAFVAAEASGPGRIVAVPATRVLRLVPEDAGKFATVDLDTVPALRSVGVAAVLLQINADVGRNGGLIEVGDRPETLDHHAFWAATKTADRTRNGFLVVPVTGRAVFLHYQAGSLLTVDVVGYVTDDTAAPSVAGLVVPLAPGPPQPVRITPGPPVNVTLVGSSGLQDVPADRVAAALVGVTAVGEATGTVTVFAPDPAVPVAPADPTLATSAGTPRSVLTAVGVTRGTVLVSGTSAASVELVPQALVLAG